MVFQKYGVNYEKFELACEFYQINKYDWESTKDAANIVNSWI